MEAAWALLRRFWYVIPLLGLVLALGLTRSRLSDVKKERDQERAFAGLVVDATRAAASNPRLTRDQVPAQIQALGRSIAQLGAGLERCNASARAAAENDARRQAEAQRALQDAERRTQAAQTLIERLRASAGRQRPASEACEPSDTVREIWP